jgi:hypothetical protein
LTVPHHGGRCKSIDADPSRGLHNVIVVALAPEPSCILCAAAADVAQVLSVS